MSIPSLYIGSGRILTLTPWGAKIVSRANDLSITPDVALTGEYDPPFLRYLERTIQPGDAVVDVGANIGLFTMRMAWLTGPTGRVLALEPNPQVKSVLDDNVGINYATPWIDTFPFAAGAAAGRQPFHLTRRFQGNSSLVEQDAWYREHFSVDEYETIEVEVETLDRLVPSNLHLKLVKIDVEGAEASVLAGMRRLVLEHRCKFIDVEVSGQSDSPQFRGLMVALTGLSEEGGTFAEVLPDGTTRCIDLAHVQQRKRMPHLIIDLARGRA